MKLWEHEEFERLQYYAAKEKKSDAAILIFPGGAYAFLADHEGRGYAEYLNSIGYDAFVCLYRVAPARFPGALLDARRAVRVIKKHARELGIDPDKIVVMGSSAGGNLAALLCTCSDALPGEEEDDLRDLPYLPDGQVLCYPVISLALDETTHKDSRKNLLGDDLRLAMALSPERNVNGKTPEAFLWHTADDPAVSVRNTLIYAEALCAAGVPAEVHIFPHGYHGMGLAKDDPSVGAWTGLLEAWLKNNF